MAYSKEVVDHYENPRNVGALDKENESVGTGLVGAPACGDVMKLQIKVDAAGVIEDAKFKTFGCGSAIASSSESTTRAVASRSSAPEARAVASALGNSFGETSVRSSSPMVFMALALAPTFPG